MTEPQECSGDLPHPALQVQELARDVLQLRLGIMDWHAGEAAVKRRNRQDLMAEYAYCASLPRTGDGCAVGVRRRRALVAAAMPRGGGRLAIARGIDDVDVGDEVMEVVPATKAWRAPTWLRGEGGHRAGRVSSGSASF
jgi:hypothetical protein